MRKIRINKTQEEGLVASLGRLMYEFKIPPKGMQGVCISLGFSSRRANNFMKLVEEEAQRQAWLAKNSVAFKKKVKQPAGSPVSEWLDQLADKEGIPGWRATEINTIDSGYRVTFTRIADGVTFNVIYDARLNRTSALPEAGDALYHQIRGIRQYQIFSTEGDSFRPIPPTPPPPRRPTR